MGDMAWQVARLFLRRYPPHHRRATRSHRPQQRSVVAPGGSAEYRNGKSQADRGDAKRCRRATPFRTTRRSAPRAWHRLEDHRADRRTTRLRWEDPRAAGHYRRDRQHGPARPSRSARTTRPSQSALSSSVSGVLVPSFRRLRAAAYKSCSRLCSTSCGIWPASTSRRTAC